MAKRDDAASVHESLSQLRLRPVDDDLEDIARRLGAREFTGGERWPEWRAVFERAEAPARARALAHLESRWGEPIPDLITLRRCFRRHALRAHHARLGCMCLGPPNEPARLDAWERRYGPLPRHARAVLLELGTLHGSVDQDCYSLTAADDMFSPLGSEPTRELFMLEPDDLGESLAALGHALRELASGRHESIDTRAPRPSGAGERPRVSHIWSFFEGNHGDANLLLVHDGPLADAVLSWDDLQHGGGPVTVAGHIVDVLYEGYLEGFFEDVLELEDAEQPLRAYGRYAKETLRLVKDGLLETE